MPHWTATDIPDLNGKVAIVTGGNAGIGYETVKELAAHGATVYMAARTESKAQAAIQQINEAHPETKGKVHFLKLDLSDLKQVDRSAKEFLEKESKLDILVNNAGIMAVPYQLTTDGVEIQFQTNHLGPFLFTEKLAPLMEKTGQANGHPTRVINTASRAHGQYPRLVYTLAFDNLESVNRTFGPLTAGEYFRYTQSKLANILHSRELNRRYTNIKSVPIHPGVVATDIYKDYNWLTKTPFFIDRKQGAITTLYAATSPEVESKGLWGNYLVPFGKTQATTALADSEKYASDLWKFSEKVLRL